jgi:hypothetical protein
VKSATVSAALPRLSKEYNRSLIFMRRSSAGNVQKGYSQTKRLILRGFFTFIKDYSETFKKS